MRLVASILCAVWVGTAAAAEVYLDTLVKLSVPKKDGQRSREGGLEHAPFRLWLPVLGVPMKL